MWNQDTFSQAVNLFHKGLYDDAQCLAEQALAREPGAAPWLNIAALCLQRRGDLIGAERIFEQAIHADPKFADVYNNLGLLLKDLGRKAEAEALCRRALAADPRCIYAEINLGLLHHEQGRFAEAEAAFCRALAVNGDHLLALYNFGNLRRDQGRLAEAEALYRHALAIQPEYPPALLNLGNVLRIVGHLTEAEAVLCEAMTLQPADASVACSFGLVLHDLGRLDEAEAVYRAALKADPNHVLTLNNLGNLLVDLRRPEEAVACFRPAADAGHTHALGKLMLTTRVLCEWADLASIEEAAVREARSDASGCIVPFDLLIVSAMTPADQRRAAAEYGAHVHRATLASAPIVSRGAEPRQRLRIGYVSSDFSNHATTILLGGVLEAHDTSGFAISGFSTGRPAFDSGRRRVEAACARFFDLHGMTDEAAAQLIAREKIDILIDLKGYTEACRLGIQARRPTPLVISWLGYPGTLGVPRLADYLIGDPIVTPLDRARDYSETLALLPHCYQPNDRSRVVGPRRRRDEVGLPGDAVVLCCFNRSHKITPDVFALWMRLLNEVPEAVLWLYEDSRSAVRNLRAAALRNGIPDHRIIFAPPESSADHLARIQCADLAIDTFPYTSHTTGSDALWAGVPLITRIGETFASRVAASLLHNVSLPELVAEDEAAYLALVTGLARDRGKRSALREKLASNRLTAPLFDTRAFTRDLERLYRAIWDQECRGQRAPIALKPR